MIPRDKLNQLLSVPTKEWGHAASPYWVMLCETLAVYRWRVISEPFPSARKWELASALQKCIRRGDIIGAQQLIAKVEGIGQERAYFWNRLPVIACEDVGSGDPELTTFVVACARAFTPKRSHEVLINAFAFLVEKLCEASQRSRTACSLACIADLLTQGHLPDIRKPEDDEIIVSLTMRAQLLDRPDSGWRQWQRANDWRAAKLLRFLDFRLPFAAEAVDGCEPAYKSLHGLPSYSYDMYTRAGREVIRQLLSGSAEVQEIREILDNPQVKDPLIAAGEALFFIEGGYVKGEVAYVCVNDLTQRLFAARFGLSTAAWEQLCAAMELVVSSGTVDDLRAEELDKRCAQRSLFTM